MRPGEVAYEFRLCPTARQHVALAACVDGHRELYNAALQERRDAWRHSLHPHQLRRSVGSAARYRALRPDLAGSRRSPASRPRCARLTWAFESFFRRAKAGRRRVIRGFKGKARFDSVEWP